MSLDIKFENLVYCARSFSLFQKDEKHILKGISGEFRANELSAIMGPSGSGKSTLLNVLSEYMTSGVSGSITINGEKWNNNRYKKKFAYIMQEENLHSVLTVIEAMRFSIKFKTGNSMTEKEQQKKIFSILETLKLDNKLNTYAQYLSGGQQKRLSIALELVDDPHILFLDECTTGLDSVSSAQCIQFLKKLAMEGRTIICTIHTPSALMFEMFDHIYALANGYCIYQGASFNVVPFLKELGLVCPPTYNPADFLLEIANNDYGSQNERLTKVIENGRDEFYRGHPPITMNNNEELKLSSTHIETLNERPSSSSFLHQLALLVLRNYKISNRNVTLIIIRLLISSIVGLMVGGMYVNIGNDGAHTFHNFKYIFVSEFFLLYISYYSQQTAFPLELPIIKREIFNRWYTSSVYYVALSLTDVPMTIISSSIYLAITYFMTNQPLDRAVAFFTVGLLTSFVSQGFGHFASSLFDLQGTLTFAAVFLPLYGIFSGIFILVKDTHWLFHWIFQISFIKHSLDAAATAVLGWNRPKMECSEHYCHYQLPKKFLSTIDLNENIMISIRALVMFLIVFRVTAFLIMSYRLKRSL
ncbi:ATP-binding cassette subfamily G member 4-like isoform X1 [Chironomus tepperi]|uniref:ATP-binding cassette subfamily G member 4-like isoform X1 n=2 Tax=Chironomus tepperi TaxID=113505 RepID=UPI00391FB0EB